jgi:hypothetical protein
MEFEIGIFPRYPNATRIMTSLRSTLHPPSGSGSFAFRISRTRGFSRQFNYLELKARFLKLVGAGTKGDRCEFKRRQVIWL